MDAQTIDKLLQNTKAQEDEIRKDREALERVRAILNRNGNVALELPPQARVRVRKVKPLKLSGAIREAILKSGATFTSSSVRAFIEENYPQLNISARLGTLSSVLSRMAADGKIKTTESADRPGKALTYLKLTEKLL